MAVELNLQSESEKMTVLELLNKINSERILPKYIEFCGDTYTLREYSDGSRDYVEGETGCSYETLLMHISEELAFEDMISKKNVRPSYHDTITYFGLLELIKGDKQPYEITIGGKVCKWSSGDYWQWNDATGFERIGKLYSISELIETKILVYSK